jgi:hypothetical protein
MSMVQPTPQQNAERLLVRENRKNDGLKAADEYKAQEEAKRALTAKLRAERLAREAIAAKKLVAAAKRETQLRNVLSGLTNRKSKEEFPISPRAR